MMFCNKVHSSSTENILARTPSDNRFDIELQQPRSRRRQVFDYDPTHDNGRHKDQRYTRASSLPAKQGQLCSSESDQLPSLNNIITIPTNLPTISSSNPIMMSSLPIVIEEK
jgi:hypothetical protein